MFTTEPIEPDGKSPVERPDGEGWQVNSFQTWPSTGPQQVLTLWEREEPEEVGPRAGYFNDYGWERRAGWLIFS